MATTTESPAGVREDYVRVIGKAVAALDILEAGDGGLTVPEVSRRLGMSRSTVHRLLATMERYQLVEKTADGAYRLGIHLFRLGSRVKVPGALARLAGPGLVALAERFSLSSYLSIRDGDRALCVARVDRGPVMTTRYQAGDTLPLYLGAAPSILLAQLPSAEIDRLLSPPLQALDPDTRIEPDEVRRRLNAIRETGISYAADDVQVGLAAMGVPLRDRSRAVIAGVSVVALTHWFDGGRSRQIAEALRETAATIESQLQPQRA